MAKLPHPVEVKAYYRVPRNEADALVQQFRHGVIDAELLPPNYRVVNAEVNPDSADGPEAVIWVLFQRAD